MKRLGIAVAASLFLVFFLPETTRIIVVALLAGVGWLCFFSLKSREAELSVSAGSSGKIEVRVDGALIVDGTRDSVERIFVEVNTVTIFFKRGGHQKTFVLRKVSLLEAGDWQDVRQAFGAFA